MGTAQFYRMQYRRLPVCLTRQEAGLMPSGIGGVFFLISLFKA
jgi:hypothetical protein